MLIFTRRESLEASTHQSRNLPLEIEEDDGSDQGNLDQVETCLYKYETLPIFSNGYLLQLLSSTDSIAMSEDKSCFIEVSALMMASALASCHKVGFNMLCSFPSVVMECDYPVCLGQF